MTKTLIYFHGFQSGAGTATVGRFRRSLPDWRVEAPDIPQDPLEALSFLRTLCAKLRPDVILGTSLGAFYAHQMVGYRRIAVNPALHLSEMPEILHVGQYTTSSRDSMGRPPLRSPTRSSATFARRSSGSGTTCETGTAERSRSLASSAPETPPSTAGATLSSTTAPPAPPPLTASTG